MVCLWPAIGAHLWFANNVHSYVLMVNCFSNKYSSVLFSQICFGSEAGVVYPASVVVVWLLIVVAR